MIKERGVYKMTEGFKTLKNTSIYGVSSDDIETMYKKILSGGNGTIKINPDMISDTIDEIRKRSFKNDAKYAVISAIERGEIQIVYNEKFVTPLGIPFIKTSSGIAVINITKIANISEDGTKVEGLDTRLFYGICFTALLYARDELARIYKDNTFLKMYADMMLQVFNVISIIEPNKKPIIKYLAAKFYLMSQIDSDKRIEQDARVHDIIVNGDFIPNLNTAYVNEIDAQFKLEWFDNLQLFLYGIHKTFNDEFGPTFSKTKDDAVAVAFLKKFITIWYTSFGQITGFGCEYPPYLIMVMMLIYFKGTSRIDFIRSNKIEPSLDNRGVGKIMKQMTDRLRK